jgi:RNA polymerase sigma-70 factor, ECF subfamily
VQLGKERIRHVRSRGRIPDVLAQSAPASPDAVAAFCDAYLRWSGHLYRLALRRSCNAHDAEDVVAETFRRAWGQIDALMRADDPGAWLGSILRHVLFNHYRSNRKRTRALPAKSLAEEGVRTDGAQADEELRTALLTVVLELPAPYKEVLIQYYFNGHDLQSIAASARVPANTVKWWLWKGRQHLRENRQLIDLYYGRSAKHPSRDSKIRSKRPVRTASKAMTS